MRCCDGHHKFAVFDLLRELQQGFRNDICSESKLSGQSFRSGATGAPILVDAPGAVECRVTSIVEQGDHHIVVDEVVEAHLNKPLAGR
jgi:flavin reductase (DIM6/NTAB) family NADH-FMN oxidoreductase RutF